MKMIQVVSVNPHLPRELNIEAVIDHLRSLGRDVIANFEECFGVKPQVEGRNWMPTLKDFPITSLTGLRIRTAAAAASKDLRPVVIRGPAGVGKRTLAQAILRERSLIVHDGVKKGRSNEAPAIIVANVESLSAAQENECIRLLNGSRTTIVTTRKPAGHDQGLIARLRELSAHEITMPALTDRPEDIAPMFLRLFLKKGPIPEQLGELRTEDNLNVWLKKGGTITGLKECVEDLLKYPFRSGINVVISLCQTPVIVEEMRRLIKADFRIACIPRPLPEFPDAPRKEMRASAPYMIKRAREQAYIEEVLAKLQRNDPTACIALQTLVLEGFTLLLHKMNEVYAAPQTALYGALFFPQTNLQMRIAAHRSFNALKEAVHWYLNNPHQTHFTFEQCVRNRIGEALIGRGLINSALTRSMQGKEEDHSDRFGVFFKALTEIDTVNAEIVKAYLVEGESREALVRRFAGTTVATRLLTLPNQIRTITPHLPQRFPKL
jgi:hypothetical protein